METVFHSILVGDDGSPTSRAAVAAAIAIAHASAASLVLLGILEPPAPTEQAEGWGLDHVKEQHAVLSQQLAADAEQARGLGIEVHVEVLEGDARKQLEKYAMLHTVDLLVLGHRELSRPRRWLEGSTSEELARSLHVSILLVRSRK